MIGTALFVILLIVGFAYMLRISSHKLPHYCEDCGRNLDDIPMGINMGCASCDACSFEDTAEGSKLRNDL